MPARRLVASRPALATVALATLVAVLMAWSGGMTAVERAIEPLRFAAAGHRASGKVVIVEMDAASVAAIRRWPWSRLNYAKVVDALHRAGAGSIVFDVDFSAPSDSAGDAAFAAALARVGGLIALPTFGQQAGSGDRRTIDALPIPALRRDVALASVNMAPDSDSMVRDMPFATMTAGVPRPSLSAYVAERSGASDDVFPIDMGIDPASIPRLSFVAVRDGRFDPAAVRGRNVMIGATAIEMGDRYGAVRWGVLPGVVIQALAAETLIHGVPRRGSAGLGIVLAALLSFGVATAASLRRLTAYAAVATGVLVLVVGAAWQLLFQLWPIAEGLAVIGIATAVTAIRILFAHFRTLRLVDEASGLPNRRALLAMAGGEGIQTLAVLRIVSFDNTLAVLGRDAGTDVVLRVVDRVRLAAADDAVYRLGDNMLAFRLGDDRPAEDVMAGLRAIMLQPIEVLGRRIDVACTLGVASGPIGQAERLLTDATLAAEEAQRSGGFWRSAATDLGERERAITLMGELDAAIHAGEIEVHYQPKLRLADDHIASTEALVRWRHPTRGFVGPDLFIPMAEQTDRIMPLTLYVLGRVLADARDWRMRGLAATAAVNISATLLSSTEFNASVDAMLRVADVPGAALIFEVTESAAMSNPEAARAALDRYRELGIAVSMDDYGTGQSTLTYLRGLPLTELKIDRSFVQHAHRLRNDGILVRSTIDMAHEIGLKVVAEGVEDMECLDFLRHAGCDFVQGYLIGRAVPAADFVTAALRHNDPEQALRQTAG